MKSPYNRVEVTGHEEPEIVLSISLEKYDRCNYCNSKLVYNHDLNISFLQVIETGKCPGCGVSHHPKKFTLH